jgi:hypothetical protein
MEEESIFSCHNEVGTTVHILIKLYGTANLRVVPLTHKYLSPVCEIAMVSRTDGILLSVYLSVQLSFASQSTHVCISRKIFPSLIAWNN